MDYSSWLRRSVGIAREIDKDLKEAALKAAQEDERVKAATHNETEETSRPPKCIDCAYHSEEDRMNPLRPGGYESINLCHHPRFDYYDVVTGITTNVGTRCHFQRTDHGNCGKDGKEFKLKEV